MRAARVRVLGLAAVIFVGLGSGEARALPFVLSFEGLQNLEEILGFYDGGTGSLGSSGANVGVSFGSFAVSLIDADAGGGGNIANEPSADTVAGFLAFGNPVVNVAAGFQTGFSFYYSGSMAGTVSVYDGLNATGSVLGTVNLVAQGGSYEGCALPGDPTGYLNCWDPAGVAFSGTALSISFAGATDNVVFDNMTFGSSTPIPEPTAAVLLGLGLTGVAAAGRRRRPAK